MYICKKPGLIILKFCYLEMRSQGRLCLYKEADMISKQEEILNTTAYDGSKFSLDSCLSETLSLKVRLNMKGDYQSGNLF